MTYRRVWLVNSVAWCCFWIAVAAVSVPYVDPSLLYGVQVSVFSFGDRAVPPESEFIVLFPFAVVFHAPSYFPLLALSNLLSTHYGLTWNHRIGSLSVGTYVLLCTMILSFLQWYLLTMLANRLVGVARGRRGTRGA